MTSLEQVNLIPRKLLFGNPDKASPRISPDGSRISYLAPVDGVLNVWVGPADDPNSAVPVTHDTGRGIRMHLWAFNSSHIIYLQDKDGDENWHVYSVNLASGETKDLTPFEGVHADIKEISHKFPSEIVVGLNNRDPQLHDVYRVNVESGELQLVTQNEGYAELVTDEDFNVRFGIQFTPDGSSEFFVPENSGWKSFMKIPSEDALTTMPHGFDKTGSILFINDSRGRDTSALCAVNLNTGEETLLCEDPRADVGDVMTHPTERHIQAVSITYDRKEWRILDPSIEDDMAYLGSVAGGEVSVVSRSLDDSRWIAAYIMDDGPMRYYLYERNQKQATFLFTHRQALEGLPLAKMHSAVIKSRDGLNLVCYYTLPIGSDSNDDGRPDAPLPMVLDVHGGPWWRDFWGYNPTHQHLANRGYAVMSVNFRGSTGFGKSFINAAIHEWGGKMHDDLIDAVQWAVGEGIADPSRGAITAGSYGGYAALAGVTFTPDVFACSVDIVGPSNLVTMIETIPPYWAPLAELEAVHVGDARTEEGRAFLKERSPLTYVDRIVKPLLIGHGANDPRVKQAESDQIVSAMQERQIPVTYVLYPDEGHGFARPENNLSFYAVMEAFLAQHLEGRAEPIGNDFDGSSITVPTGAEHVPGLAETLR